MENAPRFKKLLSKKAGHGLFVFLFVFGGLLGQLGMSRPAHAAVIPVSASLSNYTVGASMTIHLVFTVSQNWRTTDYLRYNYTGVSAPASGIAFGIAGTVTAICSGGVYDGTLTNTNKNINQVAFQRTGATAIVTAGTTVTCDITGLTNPLTAGASATTQLVVGDSSFGDFGTVPSFTFINALTSTNVEPATLTTGSSGTAAVSFTSGYAIPNTGKVKVTFGAGYNVSGASGGNCSTMDGSFSTSVSGQTVTITRSGGTSEPAGAQTCAIDNIVNSLTEGSTGVYGINVTTAADEMISADVAVTADTIVPSVLTGTNVQPASLYVGASSIATVTFTNINPVPSNGKIRVTFPTGYVVSGATGGTCSSMDGSFATSISGQTVTITRSGGTSEPAGPQTCTINTVVNPSTAGVTGTYTIRTTDSVSAVMDADTAVPGDTMVTGVLSGTNVEPATLFAGAIGIASVTFTTVNPIPNTGKIKVTFPAGYVLTGVAAAGGGACSSTMDGTFTSSVSGQIVTITRSGTGTSEPAGPQTCTINGVGNPPTPGITGLYAITTTNVSNATIDTDASVPADTILAGSLTSTNVQPATLLAGASGTSTVSFTIVNPIPATGKIKVTFGSGFNVAGANNGKCTSMDGSFATSISGQTVTITRSGGTSEPASAQTCTIAGIVNPPVSGSTGVYDITTTSASDAMIDTDAAVSADTITAGTLSSTNVEPATLYQSASGMATITFTTSNPIPGDGKIKVTFPSGYNVSGATGATCTATMDGAFSTSVSGQVVTITRSGGTSEPIGAQTCTINAIVNPVTSGSTGVYGIATVTASDIAIDTNAAVSADTIIGVLSSTNVQPATLAVGASGTATITFTTVNAIPNTGKIKVTFGAGYNVAGATGGTCSATMDGAFTSAVLGQVVTITRTGTGTSEPAGPQTCTIGTVVNQSYAGTTGIYDITTTNSSNVAIDADPAVSADTIVAAALTSTNVQPATLIAGASGTATVTFTMANALPSAGKIRITFGAGYNVSGATGGTCSTMDGGFSTAVSGQIVTITRNGAGTSEPVGAQTCTINSMVNPTVSGSTGVYNITTTNASDASIDTDAAVTADVITPGALSATNVEPATLIAGASGIATVTFTIINPIPSTGKIKVTFPAGFNVSGATGAVCSTMDGGFSTSVLGQVVTITRNGAGTSEPIGAQTCTMNVVVNPSSTGSTGVYGITTTNTSDASIDTDAAVSADTITPGVLTSTNVQPATLYVGASGMTTVTFTNINPIPSTGKIKVTFGAGFNVSGATGGACSSMDGSFATAVSGQIVTITRSGGTSKASAPETCTINTIVNQATTGTTGVYGIAITDASDVTIDSNAAVSADTMVTGVLTSTNVEPATLYTGASGTATVTFTTTNSIASTGKIKITFGAGYNVSGASGATCSSMDGSFATSVSGQTVTITRSAGTIKTAGIQTCTIGTIVNPAVSGSTGVYGITTTNAADNIVDVNAAVSADTITAGALTSTNVEPATLYTGASGMTTVTFTTVNPIPSTGKIKVTFGAGFNVSVASGATCSSMDGSFATSISGQVVTITRSAGTSEPAGPQTCTMNAIINPSTSGSTGVYGIETTTAGDASIDINAAVTADIIAPGVLTSTNVEPATLYASASGMTTVTFTTVNPIPNTGKVKVTFGAGFNVAGAAGATCSSMDGSFATAVSGQTVTITRSAGTTEPIGPQTCTINTIVNQSATGTTGVYGIMTTNTSDVMIDSNATVSADTIVTGVLTSTNVEPASLYASASGMTTVTFTTVNPIPSTGKIKVTFGAGFNVSGASGGTCSSMDGSFATAVSGQTVTITRSAGTAEAAGIQTCTINTIINQSTTGTTGVYGITTTIASDAVIDTDVAVPADTILNGALTNTNVIPATLYVSASGMTTVLFTTANPIPATGKIKVTFGAGFNVSAASGADCSTMDGSFATTVSGQTVTITRSSGSSVSAGAQSCTINTIVNQPTPGSTGVYSIVTTIASDAVLDTDAAVSADTIITGVLTSTNVEPYILDTGASVTTTITFTTANPIASTGKIKVTFGSGFNVAGATGGTCSTMDGSFATAVSGQTVTLTRSGGTSQPVGIQTCVIYSIVNPGVSGSTGVYTIETTTAGNNRVDIDAAVPADTITPGALSATDVEPSSLYVGSSGTAMILFTTNNPIPNDGKVKVTFGAGYNLSSATGGACSSMDGVFFTNISGQVITITRSGGSAEPAGIQNCTINNVVNQSTTGTTGVYDITTTNAADAAIDTNPAVSADTIVTGVLTSTNVIPATLYVSASGMTTVLFTSVNVIPNSGKIKVTFGAGYNVSGATGGTCSTMDGSFATSVSGQTVILARSGGTSEPAGPQICTINTIVNQSTAGTTGVYAIESTNASDNTIDIDAAVSADTIVTGVLASTNVQPATLYVSASGTSTITFTTANSIPATGKIKVTFGAGFNVAGAAGGTCSTMDGSFSTSVSGQVVTLTRSGGTSEPIGPQVCTINTIVNQPTAGTTGVYGITTSDATDAVLDTNATVSADTIVTGVLTSTDVEPATLYTGASGIATVRFTTANPISSTGKIKVTFGAGYNVAGATGATCSSMDGSFAISVSGQIVTITRSGGSASAIGIQNCTISTIVNPVVSGSTGVYGIETTAAADTTVDINAAVTADTITPGILTSTDVEPATLYTGASGVAAIRFTTTNAIPSTGKIKVTFGAGYDISGAAGATCSSMDGSFATTVSGQVVTITRSGGTSALSGIQSCTINTIVNPAISGSTGVYDITTATAGDIAIDENAAVTADIITPGALTSTDVEPATLYVSASGMTTVTFTMTNPLPSTGKIKITFGAGYNVAGATGATCSSMDGSFATSVSGQVVTITRSAGTSEPAGPQICTINTIINQPAPGTTGVYDITTYTGADVAIDTNAAVSADTIVTGALSSSNVEPETLFAGATGMTTVTFTTINAIPSTGKIKVTFGAGYNVAGAVLATCSSMDGSFATAISGQIVTITRSAGTSEPAGPQICTINGIANPIISGSTGIYDITTATAADAVIDNDPAVAADTISAGALSSTNVEPATLLAGATGVTTVSFYTINPIPSTGKIKVTFGAGYNVAGANSGTCSTMDGSYMTTVSGQTVTLTRSGGVNGPAGSQICTINTIINPPTAGLTGLYDITITTATDVLIDADAGVPEDVIVANALTATNVEPATLVAGASGMTTVTFTSFNPIPSDGKIRVTFGAGYNVSGATGGTCSSMDGSFATSISGQTVYLTRSGGTVEPGGAQSCTINSIVNPVISGSTGVYDITTETATDVLIDDDSAVPADTITASALSATNVEPATLTTGATGMATVTFFTVNPIPSNGKIKVTFGAGFDVSGASGGTCSTMNGSYATAVSGQTVTLTRSGGISGPSGSQICTINTIINPNVPGSTGVYGITTTDASDVAIEFDAAVPADTITVGALTGTNVQPNTLVAGDSGTAAVTFTTINSISSTGKIKVTFGAGFNVAGATGATCSGMDGSFGTTVSGQTVTIARSAGTLAPAGAQSCTINSIVNPVISGSTGVYGITVTTAADVTVDVDAAVSADTITASGLAGTNVEPATLNTGATGMATVTFTTNNPLPSDGIIKVTFGAGFNVSGASGATCSSMDGSFGTTVSGQTVTITRSTGTDAPAGAQTCTINTIVNPITAGLTDVYGITTATASDVMIDENAAVTADMIVASALSATNVEPATLIVSASGTATITFTTVNPIPGDGMVHVLFGGGYNVSGATGGTCSSMDGSFTTSVYGQLIMIARSGGTSEPAGPQTCTIGNIVNPSIPGSTDVYYITTVNALDASIDTDVSVPADMIVAVPGIIVSAISGNTTEAGGTATYTIVLHSSPIALVTVGIGISSSDTTEGTVSTSSVEFTSDNWYIPITITVTGVDDSDIDGNIVYTIINAAAVSADPAYNGIDPADLTVTNIDNETAGITVSAISGNTTEAGGTATYTIVLNALPTADVTIGISSSDESEGTVSTSSITFTTADWNVPVTVTVTGVDDSTVDGNVAYTIVNAAAVSSDPNYSGLNPGDVAVTNTDNDTSGGGGGGGGGAIPTTPSIFQFYYNGRYLTRAEYDLLFPPAVSAPVVSIQPEPAAPTVAPETCLSRLSSSQTVLNPSILTTEDLVAALCVPRKSAAIEDMVSLQVRADAKEFDVPMNDKLVTAIRNFIIYGISYRSIQFGQGERRAIARDYMDTVHFPYFVWTDVDRMSKGLIPINRNLEKEKAQVARVLPVFTKIFGHKPNFKNAVENLSWNTLMYRIRFTRDMVKEAKGISVYYGIYNHNPLTPFSWSLVRVLGYVK